MVPPVPALATDRLELRPLAISDAGAIQAAFPQWEVVRYLAAAVPWPYPPDGALRFLRDVVMPGMEAGASWCWSIRRRDDPERLIGVISLRAGPDDNRGFWLVPEERRQGFVTEASEAVTRFWFETLGRPVLRIPKAVANQASRCISLRQGMRVVATLERDYVEGRLPSEMWELTAEKWRARQG